MERFSERTTLGWAIDIVDDALGARLLGQESGAEAMVTKLSKPIESAEEFALELADHCEAEYPESGLDCDLPAMASLIEARDNAVRLALLDEAVALILLKGLKAPAGSYPALVGAALGELASKYKR